MDAKVKDVQRKQKRKSVLCPNSDIPCLYLPAELPCRPMSWLPDTLRARSMRTGYEKHTLSNAAIWYGLTTSCIRISNLNNKGHVQLCHLSCHFFLFATAMYCKKRKVKIYTCNCHFFTGPYSPTSNDLYIWINNDLLSKGYIQHSLDFPVPNINICI